jgi:hypothetical protein
VFGAAAEWCYLGVDVSRRRKAGHRLSHIQRVSIGEELNRVAHDIKQRFLDWMGVIAVHQRNRLNWWASAMSSRSPLQTDFFLLMCYAELVRGWIRDDRRNVTRIVVVEDPWLLRMLGGQFKDDRRVKCCGRVLGGCVLSAVFWLARSPAAAAYLFGWSLWAMLLSKLLSASGDWHDRFDADERAVLIFTWIEPRCFANAGEFHDPYTGRLSDILAKHKEHVLRITPLVVPTRLLRRLRGCSSRVIITAAYLSFPDIVRALWQRFRIDDMRKVGRFEAWDVSPLLFRELLREWGHPGFAREYLFHAAVRRLIRRHKDRIKCVVYPFENQPWEKMLCAAIRREAPGLRIVGYQHSSVPSLLLNFFLGRDESVLMPLPDHNVANGPASLQLLRQGNYPSEMFSDGGAFRFEYLFGPTRTAVSGSRERSERGCVLVGVPSSRYHAVDLLDAVVEALGDPAAWAGRAPECIIKCHPDLPIEMMRDAIGPIPESFVVATQPLGELFQRADVFLYAPPTTSCWEAYVAGLPTVKYVGDLLDVDPADSLGKRHLVCSRETLRAGVSFVLDVVRTASGPPNRPEALHGIFSPVDEDRWVRIVT